jgi:hypothetical protein
MSATSPIFLHSSLRSGSTWFWSRFRADPQVHAYYEPFSEVLADLKPEHVDAYKPSGWASGHPSLAAPYYREYAPLLRPEGGVAGFEPNFSYSLYYHRGAPHPPMRAYLDGLLRHAAGCGLVPVLGLCRSLGRLPWLRAEFPGHHIVTVRNPLDQWRSCHRLATQESNTYFQFVAYTIAMIGALSQACPGFFEGLPFPDVAAVARSGRGAALTEFFETLSNSERRQVFLRVSSLDLLIALPSADVLVDLDRLTGDAAYRAMMTHRLRRMTALPYLSFEDCALPRAQGPDAEWDAAADAECRHLDRYFAAAPASPQLTSLIERVKTMLRCNTATAERALEEAVA